MAMDKGMTIGVLAALLTLSLLGCEKRGHDAADANQSTSAQLIEKADQALQGATDLVAQQKDKLLQASQVQLNKLEQQVNEWLGEVATDDEQVRQKMKAITQSFRGTLSEARQAIEKARDGGLDAWQQAKPAIEATVAKAQQAHDEVMAYLKDRARKIQETEAGSTGQIIEE